MTDTPETFGRNMRDWQHELRKIARAEDLADACRDVPRLLDVELNDHAQSDAYLAAYVEWLCSRHGAEMPEWVFADERIAKKAWVDSPGIKNLSFIQAPGCFRKRGVLTLPEDPIKKSLF